MHIPNQWNYSYMIGGPGRVMIGAIVWYAIAYRSPRLNGFVLAFILSDGVHINRLGMLFLQRYFENAISISFILTQSFVCEDAILRCFDKHLRNRSWTQESLAGPGSNGHTGDVTIPVLVDLNVEFMLIPKTFPLLYLQPYRRHMENIYNSIHV